MGDLIEIDFRKKCRFESKNKIELQVVERLGNLPVGYEEGITTGTREGVVALAVQFGYPIRIVSARDSDGPAILDVSSDEELWNAIKTLFHGNIFVRVVPVLSKRKRRKFPSEVVIFSKKETGSSVVESFYFPAGFHSFEQFHKSNLAKGRKIFLGFGGKYTFPIIDPANVVSLFPESGE